MYAASYYSSKVQHSRENTLINWKLKHATWSLKADKLQTDLHTKQKIFMYTWIRSQVITSKRANIIQYKLKPQEN